MGAASKKSDGGGMKMSGRGDVGGGEEVGVLDACCQPKAAWGVNMSPEGRPPKVEHRPERYWIVLVQFLSGSVGKAAGAAVVCACAVASSVGWCGRSSSVATLPACCSMEGHCVVPMAFIEDDGSGRVIGPSWSVEV